jgi:hypothetical protein
VSVEWALLGLRLLSAAALLGFLVGVFVVLWRDYRATVGVGQMRQRGRLIVIRASDGVYATTGFDAAHDGQDEDALADFVGTDFPLLPLTTLGRAPTNTIVLNDSFCSQEHALLAQRAGQWWLEDRNSSNGTRLNGEPVREPVVVSSGDVIGVGRIELKLELA